MLSLWKLRVGAEEYYLGQVARGIDDYYSGAGETQGRWLGVGADRLDLAGGVTGDDLRAILAGLRPGTGLTPNGEQLRSWKGRIPGFDLTFAAPKSVSILYALGDPLVRAQVVEATDAAVEAALAWLEREACFVRRGSNNRQAGTAPFETFGTRRLPGVGFVAAGFRHRTSRAGDPHLHTHVLVANLTRGPDGRWSALDGQGLYRSKRAAGAVFQTVLRSELSQRLGVEWGPIHHHLADIAGIPRRVIRHFSKRRDEILDELARTGLTGPAAAADAMLATRTRKLDIDADTLDAHWRDEAANVDYTPADVDRLLSHARPTQTIDRLTPESLISVRQPDPVTGEIHTVQLTIAGFARKVAAQIPECDSTVSRHDIVQLVAEQLVDNGGAELIDRLTDAVLADPELVPLPQSPSDTGWEQRWTTRTLLALEAELTAMFTLDDGGHRVDSGLVEHVVVGAELGADQADTVRRVCTQGRFVEVVVGRAGTGKTYTMNTVRHVFETAGYTVVGVAPSARAARELHDGAGIESYTFPRFTRHATLDQSTVVVIDEAAMAGTLDLHQVISRARQVGAKVILVGDHHQLPEIARRRGLRRRPRRRR